MSTSIIFLFDQIIFQFFFFISLHFFLLLQRNCHKKSLDMQTSERDDGCLLLYYISRMGFPYHILSYGISIKKLERENWMYNEFFQLSDTINDQKECLSCKKEIHQQQHFLITFFYLTLLNKFFICLNMNYNYTSIIFLVSCQTKYNIICYYLLDKYIKVDYWKFHLVWF